jgi:hypothetical protein
MTHVTNNSELYVCGSGKGFLLLCCFFATLKINVSGLLGTFYKQLWYNVKLQNYKLVFWDNINRDLFPCGPKQCRILSARLPKQIRFWFPMSVINSHT